MQVVVEHYDEVVFSEPQQDFAKRVKEVDSAGRRPAPYTEITPSCVCSLSCGAAPFVSRRTMLVRARNPVVHPAEFESKWVLGCAAASAVPKHLEVVELSRINQARKVVLKQIHYLTSKGVAAA